VKLRNTTTVPLFTPSSPPALPIARTTRPLPSAPPPSPAVLPSTSPHRSRSPDPQTPTSSPPIFPPPRPLDLRSLRTPVLQGTRASSSVPLAVWERASKPVQAEQSSALSSTVPTGSSPRTARHDHHHRAPALWWISDRACTDRASPAPAHPDIPAACLPGSPAWEYQGR